MHEADETGRTDLPSPHRCGRRGFLAACALGPILGLRRGWAEDDAPGPKAGGLDTESRISLALMRFRQGYHCSQAMLEAFAPDLGLEPEAARRLAAALAGGSGVGGEGGVVGSAYLVLGARHASPAPACGDVAREEALWSRVRALVAAFRQRHGAITCRELLGVDVFTRAGHEEALRRDLYSTRCPAHIRSGIEILEALAGEPPWSL